MSQYDLIVVGGGSGGSGAAITAARKGMRVLWIEKERRLGGTGTNAYVNCWQPAYSAGTVAREICQRLMDSGEAHFAAPDFGTPAGWPIYRHADEASYDDTLRRWIKLEGRVLAPAVVYTPSGMDTVLREMARETGSIDLWDESVFLDVRSSPGDSGMDTIDSVEVYTLRGRATAKAKWFIDATADIELARKAGCGWAMGREPKDTYEEPSAPAQFEFQLNGWTLCFLAQVGPDLITGEPGVGPNSERAHIGELPQGGYCVNMVFQIPGAVGWAMGMEQAREYLMGNIFKRWPRVQKAHGLEDYGIVSIAPRCGVREGPRLVGRYVLTQNDFRRGEYGKHHDDCVAFCDHAMDSHLPGEGCTEVTNGPFGVPFRCLQPVEISNLLVASRGASCSSLAASACRLQRTMVDLGEAAAHYVATGQVMKPALPPYKGWPDA